MKEEIIITGASGFVGKNLLPYLSSDYRVRTLSRATSRSPKDLTWNHLEELPKNAKAVIHLAGKAHDVKGQAKDQEYVNVNLGLTQVIFEAYQNTRAEIFIYFSSVKAVASKVEGVLHEDDKFEVDNPYGHSKRDAEDYLLSYQLKPHQRLYILRPCMIHGPGNKGNLNLLYRMAKAGLPFPFGAFYNERSFLGVENLKEVVAQLIKLKPESGVYNLSDDGYLSTTQVYNVMGEHLGSKAKIWKVPPFWINLLGKIGDNTPLPIDSLKIMKLTENYRVSNSKIKLALGWSKMPFGLKENLCKTLKSFE